MKKFTLNLLIVALTIFSLSKVNAQTVVDLTAFDSPAILADTLASLNSGDTVLLKPGMTYNADGYAFDKSVTIQSSEPSNLDLPKIECQTNFNFASGATVDSVIFRNIEFMSEFDGYNNRYAFNINVGATIGKLMFDGCYIHGLRGVTRMKDAGPGSLDQYVINNSVVTMIRDYGILTVDIEAWACNNILFQNSTFSKIRAFITSRSNSTTVVIDGCTLSEYTATGQRMFRWRTSGTDNVTDGITVRNTLWGTGWDETATDSTAFDGFDGLGATTWTFENTFVTSDYDIGTGKDSIQGFNVLYSGLSTDLWVNPAEGNFNYADTSFAGIGNAGDQRWGIGAPDGGLEMNISAAAFKGLGTVDKTVTVAGLTIFATPDKTVVIDGNNKTVDTVSFTNRLKLGGTGGFDADGQPLNRVLSIDLHHSAMVTVAAMSSSSSSDRVLNIAAGNKDNIIAEFPADSVALTMADYNYYGGPTKLYLYSASSGVNVYYIKVSDIVNIDAKLGGLSTDIGALDPVFDADVAAYTVNLPSGTTSVTVTAKTNDPNASVSGDGAVDVSSGSGTATVVVTAEDGSTTMTYTIDFSVATSVDKALNNSMSVYPTVSNNGSYKVEFKGKPGMITVYDFTGRKVLRRHAASNIEMVNLEKAGAYIFRLESENEFKTVRVISVR